MADLRTDYKDDLLDTSVNTQRNYRMITNDDGTVSFVDETVYTQNGDTFGASEVNQIHAAVNLVNESLTLDYSNMSPDVQDVRTLLQLLGERFYPPLDYIYNLGNQYEDVTGGWTADGYTYSSDFDESEMLPAFVDSANGIVFTVPESTNMVKCIGNKSAIDLTDKKYLYIKSNFSSVNGGVQINISGTKVAYHNSENRLALSQLTETGEYIYKVDISAISGLCYIIFSAFRNGNNGGFYGTGVIESVWFE